ncbi:MAG: substrate-binding domain-containing protein [Chthoniobacteraceae bacterium]
MITPEKPIINRDSPLPLYKQVEEWLRGQITNSVWRAGDMLPSVKSLCGQLDGINHLTVRQAINCLVQEGVLYAVQGRGTFVTERVEKTLRIALVLPNLDDEFTREIAHGVQEILDDVRMVSEDGGPTRPRATTVVLDSRRNAQKEDDNIWSLSDMPLDGAIIFPLAFGRIAERLLQFKLDHFPFVLVDAFIPELNFDSVRADHYKGAYEATMHLLKGGRRRLAWVGNRTGYYSCRERHEGFRDAINDFGLPYDRSLVFDLGGGSPTAPFKEALHRTFEKMQTNQLLPDGIVAGSDLEAIAWLEILQSHNICVPEQVAVVGFDDHPDAAHAMPPLTTVRQPAREIGSQAAKLVLERIANPGDDSKQLILPVSLVIRDSSVPKIE